MLVIIGACKDLFFGGEVCYEVHGSVLYVSYFHR